jgi:hypothetical protein
VFFVPLWDTMKVHRSRISSFFILAKETEKWGRENAKKCERIAKMRERGERKKEYRRKEMMLKSEFRDSFAHFRVLFSSL